MEADGSGFADDRHHICRLLSLVKENDVNQPIRASSRMTLPATRLLLEARVMCVEGVAGIAV